MSNQSPNGDQENRSNPNSAAFKLNPAATEFVPKFGGVSKPTPSPPQPYQQQHNLPPNSYYKNQNNNFVMNQNDIDPIEMEARCEAVVEILQDERIREHLNPVTNGTNPPPPQAQTASQHKSPPNQHHKSGGYYQNNNNNHHYQHQHQQQQQDFNDCDDEEEMFEMMAMQEECRMEMMKFYIQSQNPELFSEIYHDVSYPEQSVKLNPPAQQPQPQSAPQSGDSTGEPAVTQAPSAALHSSTSEANESPSKSSTSPQLPSTTTTTATSVKQEQQQEQAASAALNPLDDPLDPRANEFLPNKLGELDLNQDNNSK